MMIPRSIGKINCRAAILQAMPATRIAIRGPAGRDAARSSCYKRWNAWQIGETMSVLLDKRANGVAVVTLNRPHVLNALDVPAKERLGSIWQEIADDPDSQALNGLGGFWTHARQ